MAVATLAIETRDLTKVFRQYRSRPGVGGGLRDLFGRQHRELVAVDRLNLRLGGGEMVGYIGANGAGKSTTIKMLTGILEPTSGFIRVNGYDPHRQRAAFLRTIGVVFGQRSQLWWDIAVAESFRLLQRIYRVPTADFQRDFLGETVPILGIEELMPVPVRKLSLGQRMRCELAAALLHRPPLLFLDEPTIGLDTEVKLRLREFLRDLNRRQGTTVLLTTHDLGDIEAVCPRILMLDRGRILFDGSLQDLRARYAGSRTVHLRYTEPPDVAGTLAALRGLGLSARQEAPLDVVADLPVVGGPPVAEVLRRVAPHGEVADLQVEQPSVESVVAAIYQGARLAQGGVGAAGAAPAPTPPDGH